jgi:hypothetical protein
MESFFASLKKVVVSSMYQRIQAEARARIFDSLLSESQDTEMRVV